METQDYLQRCDRCGFEHSNSKRLARCPECRRTLKYMYERVGGVAPSDFSERGIRGLWRFHRLLPVSDLRSIVTLGEVGTLLNESQRLPRTLGFSGRLFLKDETQNCTGTNKDRPVTLEVTKTLESGVEAIDVASDGNAGPAVAAYSARLGLECIVVMPDNTHRSKEILRRCYSARDLFWLGIVV